jgi:hypothetical protein
MADIVYIAQIKTRAGTWANLGTSSASLAVVNNAVAKYKSGNPSAELRIIQRLLNPIKTKKVPGCC